MLDENKIEYPYGWIAEGRRSMNLCVDGNDAYAVECSEVSPTMAWRFPNWKELIDAGWLYYVLVYNVYDPEESGVMFLQDPDIAQSLCEVFASDSSSIIYAKYKVSCRIGIEES